MARRTISVTAEANQLRDQLLAQLESEGKKILEQLSKQFTDDLQQQGSDFLQSLTNGDGSLPDAAGLTRLLRTALTYVVSRPRITTTSQETQRSTDAADQFRLSQRQGLAEANVELAKGNKNL